MMVGGWLYDGWWVGGGSERGFDWLGMGGGWLGVGGLVENKVGDRFVC